MLVKVISASCKILDNILLLVFTSDNRGALNVLFNISTTGASTYIQILILYVIILYRPVLNNLQLFYNLVEASSENVLWFNFCRD